MRLYDSSAYKILALGLLVSACLHVFIGRFFVFDFSPLRESSKTTIVFHGSFPDSPNISGQMQSEETLNGLSNFPWKDMGGAPYRHTQLLKPQSPAVGSLQNKEIDKSNFQPIIEETKEETSPEDLGIDPQVRPYEPLRFQSK